MGNEGSSFQPHAGISKQEIESLQKTFPQKPATNLWRSWTNVFEQEQISNIEKSLRNKAGVITFQSYQQLFGDVAKGDINKKIAFLLLIVGKPATAEVNTEILKDSLILLSKAFVKASLKNNAFLLFKDGDETKISYSLLHDLIFKNEKRKVTFSKDPSIENSVAIEDIENLLIKVPLIESLLASVLSSCFQMKISNTAVIPSVPQDTKTSLSLLQVVFLNSHLPHEHRHVWRPLFNTDTDGESFSKFAGAITRQGPTIIVITDEVGNVFGGFATDAWKMGPKFVGKPESFLFHLHPKMNVYDSTPFNSNYQYFNLKQKTMPNGLGMGGQLDYFGFWIDNEFGLVKTAPSCSTYHSPQLGELEGKIRRLEVFGVGELSEDDLEAGPSVLDLDPEAQAVLEMMGKTFHSKVIREVDEEEEKKKEMEEKFK